MARRFFSIQRLGTVGFVIATTLTVCWLFFIGWVLIEAISLFQQLVDKL